jgi:hypothetical protein
MPSLKNIFFLSGWLMSAALAAELQIATPKPVSGTPLLWNKYPQAVFHKRLAKPAAGDTTFFIRENVENGSAEFDEVAFYRLVSTDSIEIFAEVAEFDAGRVTQKDAEKVRESMLNSTPNGSLNPAKGIYSNEIDIFGQTSDKDGNDKLFILLIDVRDNYEEGVSDTYVAGYFDPLDQVSNGANYGEIIYIDTNPADATDEGTLSVVAHELQHLIHSNYDSNESTWINEALSQLAPRLLGLPVSSFAAYLNETNRSLMDFDNSLTDYAKVDLFAYYIYKRFGLDVIKKIVSNKDNSLPGLTGALVSSGYSVATDELLRDWFVANLLNDPALGEGQYSYGGAAIPTLSSNYFHANFTEGETINLNLNPAAAEYIQFYSGSNIDFEMSYQSLYSFNLAVIKHYETPEVTFLQRSGTGTFNLSDESFGVNYSKLSIVPYWPAEIAADRTVDIAYSATGVGGYAETEMEYDSNQVDFFIELDGSEAAEKFTALPKNATLSAVKILTYGSEAVTVKIYDSLSGAALQTISNIMPDEASWTKIELDTPVNLSAMSSFAISVTSSENSLAYSSALDGSGHAYLKYEGIFYDLSYFSVTDGSEEVTLTGNWAIRAVVLAEITTPAKLSLKPDSLYFWQDEYSQVFRISNGGTEILEWNITVDLPNWLEIEPLAGTVATGSTEVQVSIDRNLLMPGMTELSVPINSTGGDDTIYINILNRNDSAPQAAIMPGSREFGTGVSRLTLRLFNIGIDSSVFAFRSEESCLQFLPADGIIPKSDTLDVEVFLDRQGAGDSTLNFYFFDGIDTLEYTLTYPGWNGVTLDRFTILNPFPNPFLPDENPELYIPFRLTLNKAVTVLIFNLLGQEVYRYKISAPPTGLNVCVWNGRDQRNIPVSSGIYIIIIRQGGRQARQKILLIK